MSEIWYTFNLTQVTKRVKIFAKLIHQGLRYGVSDGTFEAKKDQPKLDIRTLIMVMYIASLDFPNSVLSLTDAGIVLNASRR